MAEVMTDALYKWINQNWLIKSYYTSDVKKLNAALHSASTYETLVGSKLSQRHFNDLLLSQDDKVLKRLRRGITIEFRSR